MALKSKQRARLRAIANSQDAILHVGKDGVGLNLVRQADDALTARELIKGRVLETAPCNVREAAESIAKTTGSEVVLTIGSCFVLYRENRNLGDAGIKLPKG